MAKKKEDKGLSFLRQLTIIMGLIALAIVAGVGIFFFSYSSSDYEINVDINPVEEEVVKSVPFEIEVEVNNQTQSFLKDVEIMLDLKEDFKSLEYNDQQSVIRGNIGTIGEKGLSKRTYRILPTGEPGLEYEITGSLSYSIGKTSFEKEISKKIKIDKSAISVNIKKPEQILAGSTFDIKVNYKNKTDFNFSDLGLEISYPDNFNYMSSNLAPSSFNNYWNIGTLKGGGEGSLVIKGSLSNSEESIFGVSVLSNFLNKSYLVSETKYQLEIEKSPVSFNIKISGNENYVAKIGDNLHYELSYKNGTGITLNNSKIKAELVGDLLDFTTLTSNARLDSLNNTLIWDRTTNPELKTLNPGESGTVDFSINLKSAFPIQRLGDKNFDLRVNGKFESPSVPYYLSANKTTAGKVLNTKVQGMVMVDAQGFYRDAPSGIVNEGTIPPKVGKPTEYTVHWVIRNYSTDIKDVIVSAGLPDGVSWTGEVKSNIDTVPSYDKDKKKVVWKIDNIKATRGVITSPVEAIFQIKAVPDNRDVGQFQSLLANTRLEAIDMFTNKKLQASDTFLNTNLVSDNSVEMSQGIVIR